MTAEAGRGGGRAVVFGASSPFGRAAALRLLGAGWRVRAASRSPERLLGLVEAGAEAVWADLEDLAGLAAAVGGCDAALMTPDLRRSAPAGPVLAAAGVGRAVFVSSHNVTLAGESPVYAGLKAAEASLVGLGLDWTVVRPTMIYGDPAYQGLTTLARLALRSPVVAMAGSGRALQQPVFFDDLAAVAAWLLEQRGAWAGRVVSVGGPQVLTLREVTRAVARAAGGGRLVMGVPMPGLRVARGILGSRFPLDAWQIERAEKDKHIPEPSPLPEGVRPATPLEAGLAHLVERLRAGQGPLT